MGQFYRTHIVSRHTVIIYLMALEQSSYRYTQYETFSYNNCKRTGNATMRSYSRLLEKLPVVLIQHYNIEAIIFRNTLHTHVYSFTVEISAGLQFFFKQFSSFKNNSASPTPRKLVLCRISALRTWTKLSRLSWRSDMDPFNSPER